jgi:hypothetical protein
VTVDVEPAEKAHVTVDADAFAWRKDVYGPNAGSNRDYDNLLLNQAREGALYALGHTPDELAKAHVHIAVVHETPADTTPDAVKLAAAFAVWRALRYTPTNPPSLSPDGSTAFPAA